MLIWQGFGLLSIIIPFITAVAGSSIGGPTGMSIGLIIGAILNGVIGFSLNNNKQELIDEKTGERVIFRRRHTLFWIPMQYISVLWLGLAIVWLTN